MQHYQHIQFFQNILINIAWQRIVVNGFFESVLIKGNDMLNSDVKIPSKSSAAAGLLHHDEPQIFRHRFEIPISMKQFESIFNAESSDDNIDCLSDGNAFFS